MTPPSENPEDDSRNTKLPPANPSPEKPRVLIPTEGVSTKIKVFVIGLTFVTIAAFGVFTAMFVKKMFVQTGSNNNSEPQWLAIADELRTRGLPRQAIEHYQKYLDTQKVDAETRSRISFQIAQLYVKRKQCDDAVVWFLHAKTAQPAAPQVQDAETHIQQCRSRAKTSP